MKPTSPNNQPGDDAEFLGSLRQFTLRPPPAGWRREILKTASPLPVRWHRSPFWRSLAALWAVLLGLWLDTPRVESANPSAGFSPASPLSPDAYQFVLAGLDRSIPRHPSLFLP
ncbi:MAG TPA: hypothetical protein VG796_21010 [Verrucomicrobiales bacterium]|jgi:hypothetical protein|nr:hypothetical protein [Verrucomicrobiales bacterium]